MKLWYLLLIITVIASCKTIELKSKHNLDYSDTFINNSIDNLTKTIIPDKIPNLFEVKNLLIEYYESGEYEKDIQKEMDKAYVYLDKRLKSKIPGEKLAIIFDIDETCLSNYFFLKNIDFGYSALEFASWIMEEDCAVIEPVLKFYKYALSKEVSIFFITGRYVDFKDATINNLKNNGFNQWSKIYMPNKEYENIKDFKIQIRMQILDTGYSIIMNIGDQQSDLSGGLAEQIIKLPNPYYLIQ